MRGWYSLLFQPLAGSVHRWQGEFSPQFRGPRAYAESQPLPLPSTIAGALAAVQASRKGLPTQNSCQEVGVYDTVKALLEDLLGEDFRIRGPYLYVEGSRGTTDIKLLCIMYGSARLYCINVEEPSEELILEPSALQYTGIALDTLSKSVIEHYIYTIRVLDLHATVAKIMDGGLRFDWIKRYGILVEIYGNDAKDLLDGRVAWMGGRQRPYRIEVLDQTPARNLASKASKAAVVYIVSPILLCGSDRIEFQTSEPGVERLLYETLCARLRLRCGKVCRGSRITFTALGLGYDLCRERKRPYCQAVMPGARFKASLDSPLDLYEAGAGTYSQLSWGTLLPLPPTSPTCQGE